MDTNENTFALEVHEEMFNEEYSISHEDNLFDQSTDEAALDENLKPIYKSNSLKKKEVKNNLNDECEKDFNYSRSGGTCSQKNNRNTDRNEISEKKEMKRSKDKRVKISPIKWLNYTPSPGRKQKRRSQSISDHEHQIRNKTILLNHKSHKNRSQKLRRSSSFELHQHLKHIFTSCQYFLIKSNNKENVDLAKRLNVWSTPPGNEAKINQAFDISVNVILVFSIKESGHFQGFARVAQKSDHSHPPINWVLPVGLSMKTLSGVFALDWISKQNLPFSQTAHILNSYNENQQIKIGRDGQEIDPKSGESLCRLFYFDEKIDIEKISKKSIFTLKQRNIYIENYENKSLLQAYKSTQSYHPRELKTTYNKGYDYTTHTREGAISKATIQYFRPETSFGPKSSHYKHSSPYLRTPYSREVSPSKRNSYDITYSSHERGSSPYNGDPTYERNNFNYKRYASSFIKSTTSSSCLNYQEDSYFKSDRFKNKYKEATLAMYEDRNGYEEKFKEPLKLDKRYAEKNNYSDTYIYNDIDHRKYKEPLKVEKQYSNKCNAEAIKKKNNIDLENHKHKKATKRKSYSSEHGMRKKHLSITPEKKESVIHSRNVFYNQQDQQYPFDPRIPPPPPFPFFTTTYLPLQSHSSYHSTHSNRKEKKSKSKHEKKY